jgi:hypothetical protein
MSVKSTQRISRRRAIEILMSEIYSLPNDTLGDLMDCLADSGQSQRVSSFDNFIVSEFSDESENEKDN